MVCADRRVVGPLERSKTSYPPVRCWRRVAAWLGMLAVQRLLRRARRPGHLSVGRVPQDRPSPLMVASTVVGLTLFRVIGDSRRRAPDASMTSRRFGRAALTYTRYEARESSSAAIYRVTMGRTRRSGHTAGEALPLHLHIAGNKKGVGSFSPRRAPGPGRAAAVGRPCQQPSGWPSYACEHEVPCGRQDAEEAAETQEAEPPKKPVA